ncbi:MAG: Flp/Fap pilin component [Pelotomaculum sp. PtaB.Bin013]|uniref:Flp family type IVb pilin n=1 Tax=Pelotomaculum isophthalicicum JI TaxID=947010 RepID=A0A9X4H055_9FIRM|nr:Flp family type IVb pilin [Pelotomaculum isophthalicicum]MDF9406930.1 Flp family type IVb pilin [Pelotomaculum isophthalicicum JI]OPX82131.1 MAG: Flp/Fap pilin component [Pelotomaculum sp. PtaB.Bin013]
MIQMFKNFLFEESGQGMAEYGLILALVACAVIIALTAIGTNINTKFGEVNNALNPQ